MRRPGVEPGTIAWKATMLTVTPSTLLDKFANIVPIIVIFWDEFLFSHFWTLLEKFANIVPIIVILLDEFLFSHQKIQLLFAQIEHAIRKVIQMSFWLA